MFLCGLIRAVKRERLLADLGRRIERGSDGIFLCAAAKIAKSARVVFLPLISCAAFLFKVVLCAEEVTHEEAPH